MAQLTPPSFLRHLLLAFGILCSWVSSCSLGALPLSDFHQFLSGPGLYARTSIFLSLQSLSHRPVSFSLRDLSDAYLRSISICMSSPNPLGEGYSRALATEEGRQALRHTFPQLEAQSWDWNPGSLTCELPGYLASLSFCPSPVLPAPHGLLCVLQHSGFVPLSCWCTFPGMTSFLPLPPIFFCSSSMRTFPFSRPRLTFPGLL